MRKIAITVPEFFDGEAQAITALLCRGDFERVHIRKPGATASQMEALIREIPSELYPRLSLHDCLEVAAKLNLGGVHLNSRNPQVPPGWCGLVSRSFHSPTELNSAPYDYAFLSPIYPSISKPGYRGDFNLDALRGVVDDRIFALGGVTPERFKEIESIGFGGVAMLGSVWRPRLSHDSFRLQYITHPVEGASLPGQAEEALRGGCRWVQLRHKNADRDTLLREGHELRRLCDSYGAVFIVDDHVELVDELNADGVHLGKNDMPPAEARKQLGVRKIIGATANSFDDIVRAAEAGADYIGLGPYRFTTTKEKLSPVLGLEGYRTITAQCREAGLSLPIVAIGGIEASDVAAIMTTGVNGVAISGAIRNAPDPVEATREIISNIANGHAPHPV